MNRLLFLVVVVVATSVFPTTSRGFWQKPDGGRKAHQLTSAEESKIDFLINSALAQESAGDGVERDRLLDEAAEIAGTRHLKLNSLRGLVFHKGHWMTPAEVAAQSSRSRMLKKYRAIRQASTDSLAGNNELALWCEDSGLVEEARAHWLRSLDFDLENAEARAQLGHVYIGNRWVTQEQIQKANQEVSVVQQLLAKHQRESEKIVRLLDSNNKQRRADGLARLSQLENPEWIVPLEFVFVPLNEEVAQVAIDRLAFFPEYEATQALMRIAVYHPSSTTRELAATQLGTRRQSEFVPDLISMLATPVTSQYSIQTDRTGGILYQHLFTQQTNDNDVVRLTGANVSNRSVGPAPMIDLRARERALREASTRSIQLENMKEAFNERVEIQNQVVTGVLSRALNLNLGDDPTAWWNWWNAQNEVYVESRPVSYVNSVETRSYRSYSLPLPSIPVLPPRPRSYECLVAGTKVWTSTGLVPVEQITVGDRVLSRDVTTGVLSYRPVIRPTVRPASPTVEIRLQGEVIRASGGHPFWVNGNGWVRARDLTSEMRLDTVRGSAPVLTVKDAEVAPLYNLVVDRDANYFVGELGVLSHDNTIPSGGERRLAVSVPR